MNATAMQAEDAIDLANIRPPSAGALRRIEALCDADNAFACYSAAVLLHEGRDGLERDRVRARARFE